MCNTHGVVNVGVRKCGDFKKYSAKIKYIVHKCDLALLTDQNNKFWINKNKEENSLKAMEFLDVTPNIRATITVVGYPKDSDVLSVTKGVV